MSVFVHSRPGELLREKDITPSELVRRIEDRFGLRVSRRRWSG